MVDKGPDIVFIGDEVSAAGYRLAGAAVHSPLADDTPDVFRKVCKHADVVMVTAEFAAHIAAPRLNEALAGVAPLVLVVEDARGRVVPANLEDRVHAVLGLDA